MRARQGLSTVTVRKECQLSYVAAVSLPGAAPFGMSLFARVQMPRSSAGRSGTNAQLHLPRKPATAIKRPSQRAAGSGLPGAVRPRPGALSRVRSPAHDRSSPAPRPADLTPGPGMRAAASPGHGHCASAPLPGSDQLSSSGRPLCCAFTVRTPRPQSPAEGGEGRSCGRCGSPRSDRRKKRECAATGPECPVIRSAGPAGRAKCPVLRSNCPVVPCACPAPRRVSCPPPSVLPRAKRPVARR